MEVINRETDEEVDEVAVLAVRDLLKSFHQAVGKTKSAVLWPNSHLRWPPHHSAYPRSHDHDKATFSLLIIFFGLKILLL